MKPSSADSQRFSRPYAFETGREDGYWENPNTQRVIRMRLRQKLQLALELGEKSGNDAEARLPLQDGNTLIVIDEKNGHFTLRSGESYDYFDPDGIREDEPEALWGSCLTLALVNLLIERGAKK